MHTIRVGIGVHVQIILYTPAIFLKLEKVPAVITAAIQRTTTRSDKITQLIYLDINYKYYYVPTSSADKYQRVIVIKMIILLLLLVVVIIIIVGRVCVARDGWRFYFWQKTFVGQGRARLLCGLYYILSTPRLGIIRLYSCNILYF